MLRLTAYLVALFLAGTAAAAELTVFAAASLRNALDEVAALYTDATGDKVIVSYAGSSALARQIQQGAPADLFLSANIGWMDVLEKEGLLEDGTRRDLLGNRLVLIADRNGGPVPIDHTLVDTLGNGKLAMALVDAVPAGIYGKSALEHLGVWDGLSSRVAQADNVRAAMALVALGAAPFGIVYETDARADRRVHIRATFPETSHPRITYPVAGLSGRSGVSAAFLDFLSGPDAEAVFKSHGFAVLTD